MKKLLIMGWVFPIDLVRAGCPKHHEVSIVTWDRLSTERRVLRDSYGDVQVGRLRLVPGALIMEDWFEDWSGKLDDGPPDPSVGANFGNPIVMATNSDGVTLEDPRLRRPGMLRDRLAFLTFLDGTEVTVECNGLDFKILDSDYPIVGRDLDYLRKVLTDLLSP